MNKTIAVTLARGGSKSIPKKNLAVVGNKTLLERTCNAAKIKEISNHYVSSDCDEILKAAESYGSIPVFRPATLATDTTSSADAIEHLLGLFESHPDNVIELMCTSPFKTQEDVKQCLSILELGECDSVVGVCRVYDHHPARLKYIENNVLVDFFPEKKESRRQDLTPAAYVRNGSIYAFKYTSFVKYKSRYGGIVCPYIMDEKKSINIDEELDLELAQILAKKYGW
jgi:CMP-N,N'-diacetyllegionaminic acid synthase